MHTRTHIHSHTHPLCLTHTHSPARTNTHTRTRLAQVPMLPKLSVQSPDYREVASHYNAHDVVGMGVWRGGSSKQREEWKEGRVAHGAGAQLTVIRFHPPFGPPCLRQPWHIVVPGHRPGPGKVHQVRPLRGGGLTRPWPACLPACLPADAPRSSSSFVTGRSLATSPLLIPCLADAPLTQTCQNVQGMNVLGWFARGRERHIGFMCGECGIPLGGLPWRCILPSRSSNYASPPNLIPPKRTHAHAHIHTYTHTQPPFQTATCRSARASRAASASRSAPWGRCQRPPTGAP